MVREINLLDDWDDDEDTLVEEEEDSVIMSDEDDDDDEDYQLKIQEAPKGAFWFDNINITSKNKYRTEAMSMENLSSSNRLLLLER